MGETFHDAMPVDWIGPGETTAVDVEGTPVAIANVDGSYFAFANLCPHQGTVLGGRPLARTCLIMCPEHGSVYDVTSGQCVLPPQDGPPQDIETYETRVVDDVVQVRV
jgi:3-phenylpropionate/trans-cinnamate dioxygenase ferredoxin component